MDDGRESGRDERNGALADRAGYARVISSRYSRYGSHGKMRETRINPRPQPIKSDLRPHPPTYCCLSLLSLYLAFQIKYLPLCLAMGTCPDEPRSFFMQQYR